jgi:hypothetical protein
VWLLPETKMLFQNLFHISCGQLNKTGLSQDVSLVA